MSVSHFSILREMELLEKEMKNGVQDFTVNGECSNCGSCCSNFLPLSSKEIKEIKRYIQKKGIKEQVSKMPTSKPILDATCPFRSTKEKKCLIYPVRPVICRDFRCDKPHKQIMADKAMYHSRLTICDVRNTFFGTEENNYK